MGIFDNFKQIDNMIVDSTWIEWWHFMVPNKDGWFRKFMRNILAKFSHCLKCTALDGCYFIKWNMPKNDVPNTNGLLHPKCDCTTKDVDFQIVKQNTTTLFSIGKFSNYIFGHNSKGKKEMFESWGYSADDSETLINEYCVQAKKNYWEGNYVLKNLDQFGQRLAIPISLSKNRSFYSGWILGPEGELRNTTPFGGKIK